MKSIKLSFVAIGACALIGSAHAGIVHVASGLTLGLDQWALLDFNQDGIDDVLLNVDGNGGVTFDGGRAGANLSQAHIVNFVYTGTLYNPAVRYAAGDSAAADAWRRANTGIFRQVSAPGPLEYGQFADTRGFAATVIQSGTFSGGSGFSVQETRYGWMDIEVDTTSTTRSLVVHGWAFESTPGTHILMGAMPDAAGAPGSVPEPSSHALLAAGLGALAFTARGHRRTRRPSGVGSR